MKKDTPTQILDKLNTLALEVLDEILEKKRTKQELDAESIKLSLLTIKEIGDLCKVNMKVRDSSFGSFFEEDLGMKELELKEEMIEEELYEADKNRRKKQ